MRAWRRLVRPFTLLPPLLGILSGAVCAFGSAHNPDPTRRLTWPIVITVLIGSIAASAMNAASNIVNQIADLEIDRRNKPDRPLVRGEIPIGAAWAVASVLYVVAILPTWLVVPYPYHSFRERLAAPIHLHAAFFIYSVGALATFVYSFPSFGRSKRHWFCANFTIAVTRSSFPASRRRSSSLSGHMAAMFRRASSITKSDASSVTPPILQSFRRSEVGV